MCLCREGCNIIEGNVALWKRKEIGLVCLSEDLDRIMWGSTGLLMWMELFIAVSAKGYLE